MKRTASEVREEIVEMSAVFFAVLHVALRQNRY
jgi:hypothetical protein